MQTWLEKLNDPTRDVYERRYRLISGIGNVLLFLWILVAFVVDGYSARILFFVAGGLLLAIIMVPTLRTGNIQIGAGISACLLVFFMLPFAFFYNGGIYAGAPNWCIIASMMITLSLRGKLRIALLVSDVVVTVACFAVAWMHPEFVDEFTAASAFADSFSMLVITGVLITCMFRFQQHISNQEREILASQRHEIMELNNAQSRFFASMSHEIRTPVNTIVGLNEMILREDVSDEVAEDAAQVRSASKMLLHLVNDILDMSRLESGRIELMHMTYSVGSMLSEIVSMMWVHAEKKGLEFYVDIDPTVPAELYGDEMRIKQVLINVLNNAIKYTPKGSVTLTVRGRRVEGPEVAAGPKAEAGAGVQASRYLITFSITDTGTGIKKESIPHLFTAFKRVDGAQEGRIEGTGLGLAIVKQLVELMGGTVSVNSVYTQGSTFIIEIPQEEVGPEVLGELNVEARHVMNLRRNYKQSFEAPEARALVVDDNAANLMVVVKLLRDTRMQIDTASNGREALGKTLGTRYHLIFMDHLMPEMDGISCLKEIRSQAGGMNRETKVVALTANVGAESMQLYAREGFDGYLVKPCSGESLERECIRLLPPELVNLSRIEQEEVSDGVAWLAGGARKVEVAVTTDSIADLPPSIVKRYQIGVIPHIVQTPQGRFKEGTEIESTGLVNYMENRAEEVKSLPPDVEAYEAFFAEALSKANHVIHVAASGRVAGRAINAAREAARAFNNVTIVDSGHLSSGLGMMAMAACRMASEGQEPQDIVNRLHDMESHVHSSIIVDNPEYISRAGLISPRLSKLSTALMVHPVLSVKGGETKIQKVYLGSRNAAWSSYITHELRSIRQGSCKLLFVTYVGLSQSELRGIEREVKKRAEFEQIVFHKASPFVAVNCGPGTFGLMFED